MTSRSILVGQVHSKSAMGLNLLMPDDPQAAFQAAARAFGGFCLGQLLQDLMRGPAGLGGTREKVIQLCGQSAQADLLELSGRLLFVVGRRLECGRVHRRSPGREVGHRCD